MTEFVDFVSERDYDYDDSPYYEDEAYDLYEQEYLAYMDAEYQRYVEEQAYAQFYDDDEYVEDDGTYTYNEPAY